MPRFIAYFTDIFGFAHAYQIVVIAVSIVTVLTPIKKDRRSILIALARIAGVFAARVLIEALFFWGADFMPWLGRLCFPTATLFVVILYTVLFCRARLQLRFIEAAILSSALLAVDIYVVQFAFLTDLPMALTQVLKVVFSSINLITASVLVRYKLADFRYISGLYAAFTLINSAVVIVSIYVIELLRMYVFTPVIPETEVLTMTAIFGVAMYVMTIVSYLTMYNLCDKTERAISLRIEKTIIDENAKLLDVVQKNLDDIRQIRHDVKNNYVYLRMMLENGQTDEMNDYLNELCGGGGQPFSKPEYRLRQQRGHEHTQYGKNENGGEEHPFGYGAERSRGTAVQGSRSVLHYRESRRQRDRGDRARAYDGRYGAHQDVASPRVFLHTRRQSRSRKHG